MDTPTPRRYIRLEDELRELRRIVDEQAEDAQLWFPLSYGSDAYLRQELRRLHAAIERSTKWVSP